MIAELLSILEIIGRMVLAAIGVTALLFAVLMVASWFDWTKRPVDEEVPHTKINQGDYTREWKA